MITNRVLVDAILGTTPKPLVRRDDGTIFGLVVKVCHYWLQKEWNKEDDAAGLPRRIKEWIPVDIFRPETIERVLGLDLRRGDRVFIQGWIRSRPRPCPDCGSRRVHRLVFIECEDLVLLRMASNPHPRGEYDFAL